MPNDKSMADYKMSLWCEAWVATASSSNVRDPKVCSNWADNAVAAFEERFKEKNHETN